MTASSPQVRLALQAGTIALHLRVGGIPGIPFGDSVTLSTDDGKWKLTLDRTQSEFASIPFEPGAFVVVTLGVVRAFIEQVVPDDLSLPSRGLILPGKAN